jgi:release factor glutamine methyltransferase
MSPRSDALIRGIKRLQAEGSGSARLDSRLLLAHVMGLSPSDVVTTSRQPTHEELVALDTLLDRRAAHEPVAYIVGHKEFWGLDFQVGPGVLVPRPDTETLITQALAAFPDESAPLNILDLGTGSGALLIAFLHERPNSDGLGVEQSPDAMIWARKNIAQHNLEGRVRLQGDDWLMLNDGKFDVIFSNPPYIPSADIDSLDRDVRDYEPRAALDGGHDGLDAYRALAPIIARHLKKEGRVFIEIGQGQEDKVPAVFAAAGLEALVVAPDLAGIPRCVVLSHGGKKALESPA